MASVNSLTLAKRAAGDQQQRQHDGEQQMVADMLELARADEIKVACPRPNTFCLPRVRCPVKSVTYDREGMRFVLGADSVSLFKENLLIPVKSYAGSVYMYTTLS